MIAEEVERGYLLNNKVIRPVKVRISKGHQKK
jgi:molecular chaperone GrpE (heat shock protein)